MPIIPYKTRMQIANELGISPRTLRRWLKKYRISLPTGLICPTDQEIIYKKLGHPLISVNSLKKVYESQYIHD